MNKPQAEEEELTAALRLAYYDPNEGYVGAKKLYMRLRKKYPTLTLRKVQTFLNKQSVVQRNRKLQATGSFVPHYERHQFQIDLIYLENPRLNKNKYAFTCIDALSKKADMELMPYKNTRNTIKAMQEILSRMGIPDMVYCDEGTEFTSKAFRKLMKDLDIELIITLRHAPMIERFHRTIKEMLSKYLEATDSKTITVVLPKVLENYNNSYHSVIGMSPNEVNASNEIEVWKRIDALARERKRPKLKTGDRVRVLVKEKAFEKDTSLVGRRRFIRSRNKKGDTG